MATSEMACNVYQTVGDASLRESLWEAYVESFAAAGTQCIQEQLCYTKETFFEALVDPAYVKVAVTVGDRAVGVLLCTNDLEKARVAYVNPRRLLRDYPEHAGRIYYYTAIAVRPDSQGKRAAAMLIEPVAELMDREDALSAFDFSTEKNPHLPELICKATELAQKKRGLRTSQATYTPLGGQQYGVVKLT